MEAMVRFGFIAIFVGAGPHYADKGTVDSPCSGI